MRSLTVLARVADDHTLDIGKSIVAEVGAVFLVPGRFVQVTIEEVPTTDAIEAAAARIGVSPADVAQVLAEEVHDHGWRHVSGRGWRHSEDEDGVQLDRVITAPPGGDR